MPSFNVPVPPKFQEFYPFTNITLQFSANQALGCHTYCLYNIAGARDIRHALPSCVREDDAWGACFNDEYLKRISAITPAQYQDLVKMVATALSHLIERYSTVVASGNIGVDLSGVGNEVQFSTEILVSSLVDDLGWGCVAGPVTSNHNYHSGDAPHLNQTWLLFSPKLITDGLISTDPPPPVNFKMRSYGKNVLVNRNISVSQGRHLYVKRFLEGNTLFKKLGGFDIDPRFTTYKEVK